MSFHEDLQRTKFLVGCIASCSLPVIFLSVPGVERWRSIPAVIFSCLLFWLYFRTMRNDKTDPTSIAQPEVPDDPVDE